MRKKYTIAVLAIVLFSNAFGMLDFNQREEAEKFVSGETQMNKFLTDKHGETTFTFFGKTFEKKDNFAPLSAYFQSSSYLQFEANNKTKCSDTSNYFTNNEEMKKIEEEHLEELNKIINPKPKAAPNALFKMRLNIQKKSIQSTSKSKYTKIVIIELARSKSFREEDTKLFDFVNEHKEDIIKFLASTYKIHLQIAMQWLPQFTVFLLKALNTNELLRSSIRHFKVIKEGNDLRHLTCDDPNPVSVLYVKPLALHLTKIKRNEILTKILLELQKLISTFCEKNKISEKELSFQNKDKQSVTPRYNRPFEKKDGLKSSIIYIAGGNADDKESYKAEKKEPEQESIYTDDLIFFKKYEFKEVYD